MNYLTLIAWFNAMTAFPCAVLFLMIAIFITLKMKCIQFWGIKRYASLILHGFEKEQDPVNQSNGSINGFHALFAAMATAIGTGSIVAPSLAIIAGGPGALFWLVIYLFFGSVLKYVEVVLALRTRTMDRANALVGGPMNYLGLIHPWLAAWYGFVMLLLYFFGWQTVQANTLAAIFAQESVHPIVVGVFLSFFLYVILQGGARLVGRVASYLVPIMFLLYIIFAFIILNNYSHLLLETFKLVFTDAFSFKACSGSLCAVGFLQAVQAGVYRGIFISEAGLGTSSISHAVSNVKNPKDQGILALYSTLADILLSIISGLLILITKVWVGQTSLKATLIYEVFKQESPGLGQYMLLISITLFVFTTIMGNGFNGLQIYKYFTNSLYVQWYILLVSGIVCCATLLPVPLVWQIQDVLLTLAIVPHICGLLIIFIRYKNWF